MLIRARTIAGVQRRKGRFVIRLDPVMASDQNLLIGVSLHRIAAVEHRPGVEVMVPLEFEDPESRANILPVVHVTRLPWSLEPACKDRLLLLLIAEFIPLLAAGKYDEAFAQAKDLPLIDQDWMSPTCAMD